LRCIILSLAFLRVAVHKDEANMAILPKDFTSGAGAKAPALFSRFQGVGPVILVESESV
jgi:hypothetical protein